LVIIDRSVVVRWIGLGIIGSLVGLIVNLLKDSAVDKSSNSLINFFFWGERSVSVSCWCSLDWRRVDFLNLRCSLISENIEIGLWHLVLIFEPFVQLWLFLLFPSALARLELEEPLPLDSCVWRGLFVSTSTGLWLGLWVFFPDPIGRPLVLFSLSASLDWLRSGLGLRLWDGGRPLRFFSPSDWLGLGLDDLGLPNSLESLLKRN